MDPQAAWREMLTAFEAGDSETAFERATDLLDWLERGGFPPLTSSPPTNNDAWNRQMATLACQLIRDQSKNQVGTTDNAR